MGAANSNLKRCIEDEYRRLVKQGRDYLTIDEILAFKQPDTPWTPLDLAHLGVIFMLDSNRDGRFTLAELQQFVDVGRLRSRVYQAFEFPAQMQGYCTIQMWKWAAAEGGSKAFEDWMLRLLEQNMPMKRFKRFSREVYLNRDTVHTLHRIFNIEEMQGVGFQEFLDLLQRSGEEAGLMHLQKEEFDDWVPASVVRDCVAALCRSMVSTMEFIFPENELAEV